MREEERIEPTPERLAKGGLRLHYAEGKYLSCTPEPDAELGRLIERGSLPEHFADYAHGFLEMQRSFLAETRGRTGRYTDEIAPKSLGVAASRYFHLVTRKVSPNTAYVVMRSASPGPGFPLSRIRAAFEQLVAAMNETQIEVTHQTLEQEWAAIEARDL